jgi:acetyl-CoA acetyltransferase
VDEVFLGCANQAGEDNRDIARMAALLAGLPVTVPGVTLNRLCASGMDAIGTAARAIKLGEIDLAIAGGVESMSRAPFVMGKSENPFQRGAELHDTTLGWRFVNPQMKQSYGIDSMVQTAEHVAQQEGVSREDQDAFAWRSQDRAARARAFLAEEIVPITGIVDRDEHPRKRCAFFSPWMEREPSPRAMLLA